MSTVVIIVLALAAFAIYWKYVYWLKASVMNRTFTTNATVEQVRANFEEKVAKTGWKIVDDGNPMIAQSSLAAGQQLRLVTNTSADGQTKVRVGPSRLVVKGFILKVPSKAHTLRVRMDSFVKAVEALDPNIDVQNVELKSN